MFWIKWHKTKFLVKAPRNNRSFALGGSIVRDATEDSVALAYVCETEGWRGGNGDETAVFGNNR